MINLSILIPSIPERLAALEDLVGNLYDQIDENGFTDNVELIVLMDNKKISIGKKRERLKNMAQGKYFCFLDDDDKITEDYIKELVAICNTEWVDVIYFDTQATIDSVEGQISVNITNENEQFVHNGTTLRKPSHVNAWLTRKFKKYKFSDKMYGEDFDFCNKCYPHITSGYKIDKILHYYIFDRNITQAK